MKKFYFTFGTDETQPYWGGWVIVEAPSINDAIDIFNEHYQPQKGFINCSSIYNEKEFNETGMAETGNCGAYCQSVIHYCTPSQL